MIAIKEFFKPTKGKILLFIFFVAPHVLDLFGDFGVIDFSSGSDFYKVFFLSELYGWVIFPIAMLLNQILYTLPFVFGAVLMFLGFALTWYIIACIIHLIFSKLKAKFAR